MVDIGGTTSDVGVLQHGFPREASVAVEIGGVRTNFRMPDVLSIGHRRRHLVRRRRRVTVGPRQRRLRARPTRALVFGGDVADRHRPRGGRGTGRDRRPRARRPARPRARRAAWRGSRQRLADAVDRMKTSAEPIPVVVVGGGTILLARRRCRARRELVKPDHFAVANAIGAAIAQVGGEVDRVFALEGSTRDDALEEAKAEAAAKAVAAGAEPRQRPRRRRRGGRRSPTSPGNATRIRVKAVGDLEPGRDGRCGWSMRRSSRTSPSARRSSAPAAAATRTSASCSRRQARAPLRARADGHGRRGARRRLRRPLGDDGRADGDGREAAARRRGRSTPSRRSGSYMGRTPTHTISIEAGGLNSTTPFVVAAQLGIPLVDADGMGRAFPEIQMIIATHARHLRDSDGARRREGQLGRHRHDRQPLDGAARAHAHSRLRRHGDDRPVPADGHAVEGRRVRGGDDRARGGAGQDRARDARGARRSDRRGRRDG